MLFDEAEVATVADSPTTKVQISKEQFTIFEHSWKNSTDS